MINISLILVGGNSADLIGAIITITDDDSSSILYIDTWQGEKITKIISASNYTISVSTISGYLVCADQSYLKDYQSNKNIIFQYRANGVYTEATDGILYTSSTWTSSASDKTANAIVIITNACKFRMSLSKTGLKIHSSTTDPIENYITAIGDETNAKLDYDCVGNTNKIIQFNTAYNTNTLEYAAPYCKAFSFTYPQEQKGSLPSAGQVWMLFLNRTEVDACLTACGGTVTYNNYYRTSTFWGITNPELYRKTWLVHFGQSFMNGAGWLNSNSYEIRVVSVYE